MVELLLPKKYKKNSLKEHSKLFQERFIKLLEEKVNENKEKKDPYWLLFKWKCRHEIVGKPYAEIVQILDKPPPMMNGCIVYKIDNQKGTKDLQWVIDP